MIYFYNIFVKTEFFSFYILNFSENENNIKYKIKFEISIDNTH